MLFHPWLGNENVSDEAGSKLKSYKYKEPFSFPPPFGVSKHLFHHGWNFTILQSFLIFNFYLVEFFNLLLTEISHK